MIGFFMSISVHTSIPVESVIVELEDIPWWTLLSYDVNRFDSIRFLLIFIVVVGVDNVLLTG